MKWRKITRYTTGDPYIGKAMQRYGLAYNIAQDSWEKITTLNRIKNFLSDYFSIQKPTARLVAGILQLTQSGRFLWEWIDLDGNICNLFLVNIDNFKKSVIDLLNIGILRKEPAEI